MERREIRMKRRRRRRKESKRKRRRRRRRKKRGSREGGKQYWEDHKAGKKTDYTWEEERQK